MEVIVLSGTKQMFNGEAFYRCGEYFQHKGKRLHRAVYMAAHGAIPRGYHVHHIDGDKTNNAPDNLTLMQGGEHISKHLRDPERQEYSRMQAERIRPLTKEWHASAEGRAWHSFHACEAWESREEREYTCMQCGKRFKTLHAYSENENHFCGNNCKSQFRRMSGVDDVTKVCACCGNEFRANKYARAKTCSRECGVKRRWGK